MRIVILAGGEGRNMGSVSRLFKSTQRNVFYRSRPERKLFFLCTSVTRSFIWSVTQDQN